MGNRHSDAYLLVALLLISFISVYFTPPIINRIIFIALLITAARAKLDYVYLVWFFIINDAPGRLFSAGTFDALRIPLYPITSGVSISFQELFIFLYILKFISFKKQTLFIFKREFTLFLVFGMIVLFYSFPLGMSFDNIVKTFRMLLPWSLIFIVPAFLNSRKIILRTGILLFPVVFFAFLSQIFSYISGNYPDYYLRGVEYKYLSLDNEGPSRSYSAIYITLYSIIQSLYFIFQRKNEINKNYLGVVASIGFFSIILTGTRGWMIALIVMLLGVLILFGLFRSQTGWIRITIISAVFVLIFLSPSTLIKRQMNASFQRLETMELLLEGDLTAGGTLQRLDVRGPRVMKKFRESPLIGFGFSNEFYKYADGHVAHQNILLNVGVFGYIFINGIFVLLLIKIWKIAKKKKVRLFEGKTPLIYVVGLIAVFIIHSSSGQFWGYVMSKSQVAFFAFLFASVNVALLNQSRPVLKQKN